MRQLPFCHPSGIADLGESSRFLEAVLDGLDRHLVAVDGNAIERSAALDHQEGLPAHMAQAIRQIERPRGLQLLHASGFTVFHIDAEEFISVERVDVKVAITAKGDAVETGALRRLKLFVFDKDLKLFCAGFTFRICGVRELVT